MKAACKSANLQLHGSLLKATFEVRNESGRPWRSADGFGAAYQLFDSETGILIVDGERTPLDLEPGATATVRLTCEIPPDPGRFHVFFSALHENVHWMYEKGAPFLLAEIVVDEGGATLLHATVTTLRRFRLRLYARSFARAWVYPFRTLWVHRQRIRSMVRRDILSRYRGSVGGVYWALLNPLLLMLTYFFVFGIVLQARFAQDPSRAGFALYFLAGMLPWMAFAEAVGRAPSVLLEHRNFIKKMIFPVETLPVNLVAAGLVSQFFGVLIFTIFLFVARGAVPASVVWLPVILVPQVLLTAGFAWCFSALGVFLRDLGQVIGFFLTLWFFLTPICYPEASLPPEAAQILTKNPMYVLVRAYRAIFLEGNAPAFGAMWKLTALSLSVFVAGHALFYKLKGSFADII